MDTPSETPRPLAERIACWPAGGDAAPHPAATGAAASLLGGAAAHAPYLSRLIDRHAGILEEMLGTAPEAQIDALLDRAATETAEAADDRAAGAALRHAKSRAALLIALADLGGVWPVDTVTAALSRLAETCLAAATRRLLAREIAAGKIPGLARDADPAETGYVVLAMGKLGAGELNYSSDIDLICLFDQDRHETADFPEVKARLIRVTRDLVRMIGDQTEAGYVFRTDLRLRPAPSTTPVCIAMEAAERYYESLGRTWERAAHIKARAVAGDIAGGEAYLDRLAPFVWRRHLDFAAIEDTHEMLRKIREKKGKLTPEGLPGHDLKLGPGGIREIEFFAQTRQLIAGGRDPALRVRGTIAALDSLAAAELVDRETADELAADYRAHRALEHRLQMVEDAQTQTIPVSSEARGHVAALSGWEDRHGWERDVADRLARVHARSEAFFTPAERAGHEAGPEEITEERLARLGFDRPGDACRIVERWRSGRLPATRTPRARRLFAGLEPRLIRDLAEGRSPDEAIARFDRFLSGLPAGVQVFSLFTANPHLLRLIVDICALAPRLAVHLGEEPLALDALLSRDFFEPLPGTEALAGEIEDWLAREDDYERVLDAARRQARELRFRAGVQVLRGMAGAGEAGAAFSDIAEACLAALLPRVIADFASRHGPPPGEGLAVIALGKLGSREMTAGSDLDLIIVYDPGEATQSEGPRPLSVQVYYPRLTQALVAALTAPTAEGRLYEVDMRLRPSGRKGPVATSIASFAKYQREAAWVWEHLALTRARVIAGAPKVRAAVEGVIAEALAARAGQPAVLEDARSMRARLLDAHAAERDRVWALKHAAGGLQEIEFVTQTGALATGCPTARPAPETAGALAERGWLTAEQARALADAHRLEAALQQIERVALDNPFTPESAGEGLCAAMAAATGFEDFAALETALAERQKAAAEVAEAIFAQH